MYLGNKVKIIKISRFKEERQIHYWGKDIWESITHIFSFIHRKVQFLIFLPIKYINMATLAKQER